MNKPKTSVPLDYKARVMKAMWRPMMDAFAEGSTDGEITGDDLIEFFAFGLAMVIDNDTHLTNPRAVRLAVETAKTHISRNVRTLAAVRENSGGRSFLDMVMSSQPGEEIAGVNDNLLGEIK